MAVHPDEYDHAGRLRDDLNEAFHTLVVQYRNLGLSDEEAFDRVEEFLRGELKESATKIKQDLGKLTVIEFFRLLANQTWKVLSLYVVAPLTMAFLTGGLLCEQFRDEGQPTRQQADDHWSVGNRPNQNTLPLDAAGDLDGSGTAGSVSTSDSTGDEANREDP